MNQIFLFAGPEDFLLQEKITAWKKTASEKYGDFAVTFLNFENLKVAEIDEKSREAAGEILTPSFFSEKRVIFLEDFPFSAGGRKTESHDIFAERIFKSLQNFPENNVVILFVKNPDRRTKIWKKALKIATTTEIFEKMTDPSRLADWTQKRANFRGAKIDRQNANFLAEMCAQNLRKIDSEILKLSLFCEKHEIQKSDIEKICIPSTELEAFALSNAIQSGNFKNVMDAFHKTVAGGIDPHGMVFRVIAPILRQILKVKFAVENQKTAKDVGMYPKFFNQWKQSIAKISMKRIQKMFEKMQKIDHDSKTGILEISDAEQPIVSLILELFLIENFGQDLRK